MIISLSFLLLEIPGSCMVCGFDKVCGLKFISSEVDKPFEFELKTFGFKLGGGDCIHMSAEIISLGLGFKSSEKLCVQLSTKVFEILPSRHLDGCTFAGSAYPLYLSLIFESQENIFFYLASGTSYWIEIYDTHYISSIIGCKLSLDNSGFFSYFGCEFQWIKTSRSSLENNIISFNLIAGVGSVKKNFGM